MEEQVHDSLFGLGFSKPTFGGIFPASNANTALITPLNALDASECPKFVLTAPTYNGSSEALPGPNTRPIASASMGSPARVPVPWHSKYAVWLKSEIEASA